MWISPLIRQSQQLHIQIFWLGFLRFFQQLFYRQWFPRLVSTNLRVRLLDYRTPQLSPSPSCEDYRIHILRLAVVQL